MVEDSLLDQRLRELREEGASVPFDAEELKRDATDALTESVANFTEGAAGRGSTKCKNRRGFDRWDIVPRVFRDVDERYLTVELFSSTAPPVGLAPIGQQAAYAEDGELASARAAAALNVPFTQSTPASHSLESVAEGMGDACRLFQLYWLDDWDVTASLIKRAENADYNAILVTADYQIARWMPESALADDLENDRTHKMRFENLETDPVAADREWMQLERDASVTWEDLSFLQNHTDLPIFVKGVVHPEDAKLAVDHGADGVVVSNHGGRQIDGSIATVRALPDIVAEVGDETSVFLDGGIRTGADVFKALALGADAAFLGRPYVYGLALAGERGVYEVVHNILAELDSVLGLAGYDDIRDVDREALRKAE